MVVYLIILFAIAIFAGIGCLFWPRRGLRMGLKSVNEPLPSQLPDPAAQAPKQTPDFIEELRSKDRSMNGGSPGTGKWELDFQEIRRKEKELMTDPASRRIQTKADR
jgi:hypothetical protein